MMVEQERFVKQHLQLAIQCQPKISNILELPLHCFEMNFFFYHKIVSHSNHSGHMTTQMLLT